MTKISYLEAYKNYRDYLRYKKLGKKKGNVSVVAWRYLEIIYLREVAGWTLEAVSKRVGLTRERVRQITQKKLKD